MQHAVWPVDRNEVAEPEGWVKAPTLPSVLLAPSDIQTETVPAVSTTSGVSLLATAPEPQVTAPAATVPVVAPFGDFRDVLRELHELAWREGVNRVAQVFSMCRRCIQHRVRRRSLRLRQRRRR